MHYSITITIYHGFAPGLNKGPDACQPWAADVVYSNGTFRLVSLGIFWGSGTHELAEKVTGYFLDYQGLFEP
jgi:hypothetical protein